MLALTAVSASLAQCDAPLSSAAGPVGDVPAQDVAIFQGAAGRYGLGARGPSILAAINDVESTFGTSTLPGVHSGANFAGAAGPMQIGIGGAAGDTWDSIKANAPGDPPGQPPASTARPTPSTAPRSCSRIPGRRGTGRARSLTTTTPAPTSSRSSPKRPATTPKDSHPGQAACSPPQAPLPQDRRRRGARLQSRPRTVIRRGRSRSRRTSRPWSPRPTSPTPRARGATT